MSPCYYPTMLVTKEKHGTYYYLLNSEEDLHEVSARLLKERNQSGYFYPTLDQVTADRDYALERARKNAALEYVDLSEEEVAALPAAVQAIAGSEREKYARAVARADRAFQEDKVFIENLARVVDVEDGHLVTVPTRSGGQTNLAYLLLSLRSDYQYEGFSIEYFENVDRSR